MKTIKRIYILIIVLFLSGCWDQREPERMLYVHAMGIDFKDEKYIVYSQIIDFINTAKSEQPAQEKVQSEVVVASGDTIDDAVIDLYRSSDEVIFWGHLNYLVFSKEALDQGRFGPVIDNFIRYLETRYKIWIYSTTDPINEVLLSSPVNNISLTLSKLANPKNSFEQESFIQPVDIRRLIIGLNEPGYETTIPYVSVIKNAENVESEDTSIMLKGIGIVSPKKFKGFLTEEEANGLQWMTKKTQKSGITFDVNNDKNDLITVMADNLKLQVLPVIDPHSIKFDIQLNLNAEVTTVQADTNYQSIKKNLEAEIEKQIRYTYEVALENEIDIYRLSEYVYRKNNSTWKKRAEHGKIPLSEDSIRNLEVKIDNLKAGRRSFKETIRSKHNSK